MRPTNIAYFDLTPELSNIFIDETHEVFRKCLAQYPLARAAEQTIDLIIVTKKGTKQVFVKGPSRSKKLQMQEYTIYLPDRISSVEHYVQLVSKGISLAFPDYDTGQFVKFCEEHLQRE